MRMIVVRQSKFSCGLSYKMIDTDRTDTLPSIEASPPPSFRSIQFNALVTSAVMGQELGKPMDYHLSGIIQRFLAAI